MSRRGCLAASESSSSFVYFLCLIWGTVVFLDAKGVDEEGNEREIRLCCSQPKGDVAIDL
jgi:hypothetical protein